MKKVLKTVLDWLRRFFFPPAGSSLWLRILPYAVLGVLTLIVIGASVYGWEYTNSSGFCGKVCHTMPATYTTYLNSPHAQVDCVECHIGRDTISTKFTRKAGDAKHILALLFHDYEYPLRAKSMRPARQICEKCHLATKFSDDSLREVKRFASDDANTPTDIFLILKTGGGSRR
jgi:hypothetical protein